MVMYIVTLEKVEFIQTCETVSESLCLSTIQFSSVQSGITSGNRFFLHSVPQLARHNDMVILKSS